MHHLCLSVQQSNISSILIGYKVSVVTADQRLLYHLVKLRRKPCSLAMPFADSELNSELNCYLYGNNFIPGNSVHNHFGFPLVSIHQFNLSFSRFIPRHPGVSTLL